VYVGPERLISESLTSTCAPIESTKSDSANSHIAKRFKPGASGALSRSHGDPAGIRIK